MKVYRQLLCLLLTLLCLAPLRSYAAGAVELSHPASLTITAAHQGAAIAGMQFDAYLISTVDASGELTPLARYQDWADALDIRGQNDAAWQELALSLERELVLDGGVKPSRSAVTDESGVARFTEMALGLYLVRGHSVERDGWVYTTLPFFVLLPEQELDSNTWNYDVLAQAKPEQGEALRDFTVLKLWEDECHPDRRPGSITVQLLCDGEPYGEPVTLPEDGRWQHTWTDLPVNHHWTVTETRVEGYQEPDIRREGNTFLITNTCDGPQEPEQPELPQTGQLWWPVPLLLCAGLALLAVGLLRRRGAR